MAEMRLLNNESMAERAEQYATIATSNDDQAEIARWSLFIELLPFFDAALIDTSAVHDGAYWNEEHTAIVYRMLDADRNPGDERLLVVGE